MDETGKPAPPNMTAAEMAQYAKDKQKEYAQLRAAAAVQTALTEAARKRREEEAALAMKKREAEQ